MMCMDHNQHIAVCEYLQSTRSGTFSHAHNKGGEMVRWSTVLHHSILECVHTTLNDVDEALIYADIGVKYPPF